MLYEWRKNALTRQKGFEASYDGFKCEDCLLKNPPCPKLSQNVLKSENFYAVYRIQ